MFKSKKISRHYTLLEMLVVMGILAVLFTVTIRFFHSSSKLCRKHTENASFNQEIKLIKQQWRSFIYKHGIPFIFSAKKIIYKDNSSIVLEDDKITFNSDNTTKVFHLPKHIIPAATREQKDDGEICIILNLLEQKKVGNSTLMDARIVASLQQSQDKEKKKDKKKPKRRKKKKRNRVY